jgi:hypothetical protein
MNGNTPKTLGDFAEAFKKNFDKYVKENPVDKTEKKDEEGNTIPLKIQLRLVTTRRQEYQNTEQTDPVVTKFINAFYSPLPIVLGVGVDTSSVYIPSLQQSVGASAGGVNVKNDVATVENAVTGDDELTRNNLYQKTTLNKIYYDSSGKENGVPIYQFEMIEPLVLLRDEDEF